MKTKSTTQNASQSGKLALERTVVQVMKVKSGILTGTSSAGFRPSGP